MDSVRIGIIGMGNMGSVHQAYLHRDEVKRCRLTAVCDVIPERLEPYEDVKKFENSEELIRSGEVDAVIIATPHYDHTTIGIDAFEQGIHVLAEKPISVHKADCQRLISAHEAHPGLQFGAMFQMRAYPVFQKIKSLISQGEIGDIKRTSWIVTSWFRTDHYYASGGWRATWKGEGGGVLMNQCPHNLDLLQWLCGMPTEVTAFCSYGKYHEIETEDDVTAVLRYANGATGVFVTSTGEAPGADRLEIVGDHGTIICEAAPGKLCCESDSVRLLRNEVSAHTFCASAESSFDKPDLWECTVPLHGATPGHSSVTQNFIDAILDGVPLIAPAEEGIHSVELANAMLYSDWLGQPVALPLDGAAYESALLDRIANSRFKKQVAGSAPADMAKSFR